MTYYMICQKTVHYLMQIDHAVIIATEESWFEAQYRTNTNLENIAKWLALNKLSLHTKHENPR